MCEFLFYEYLIKNRVVAQLVVFLVWVQEVAGSSPVYPTNADVVQLVRMLRMWRHRFESCMYRTMPIAVGYVCFIVLFGRKLCSLNGKTFDVGSNPIIIFFIFFNYENKL